MVDSDTFFCKYTVGKIGNDVVITTPERWQKLMDKFTKVND
jgi:hypothetical protein